MKDYLNIGLDFGTHQSKVCIEDSSDPRNRVYSFHQFTLPNGGKSFFLPSVVQINKDRTLSYGFIDENNALVLGQSHSFEKPILHLPPRPQLYKIPPKPVGFNLASKAQYISSLSPKVRYSKPYYVTEIKKGKKTSKLVTRDLGPELYQKYRKEIVRKNKMEFLRWEQDCAQREKMNSEVISLYKSECQAAEEEFQKKLSYWENSIVDVKAVYKYFKIATFSKEVKWNKDISPKLLSTWFLTFMLFSIFEEYPDDISFQMGIPESIGEPYAETQKKDAEDIFYTAYRLYKFYVKKQNFLNTSVDYLKTVTNFKDYESDDYSRSEVLILPEAFAGLLTITQQGKIGRGMTLLIDIGGGSTDISLFNVISNRSGAIPNISKIISLHRGLNYIYSLYKEAHFEMSIEEIRQLFSTNPSAFINEIETFRHEISSLVDQEIYIPLKQAALRQGISNERLKPVIHDRPVIISGGGGVYSVFHKRIHVFSEPMSVSKDLLSLKFVREKNISDEELSILSVAYGLSIPQIKEPDMTPLALLFNNIHISNNGLSSEDTYEHGLTDL